MATRKITPPTSTPPAVTAEVGIELLKRLADKADVLLGRQPLESSDYEAWKNIAREYLVRVFGSASNQITNVLSAGGSNTTLGQSAAYYARQRHDRLVAKAKAVQSAIEILELDIELRGTAPRSPTENVTADESTSVFIVHGHNDHLKQSAARFLEKLDLNAIILHELPNEGKTTIEKLENAAGVGFAVVLLTGDDRGGVRTASYDEQKLRGRQNVILELGYFLARLGRHRVCVLYESGVELPSDYDGVLYVPYDVAGLWKFQLGKELRAAGLPVDMNEVT